MCRWRLTPPDETIAVLTLGVLHADELRDGGKERGRGGVTAPRRDHLLEQDRPGLRRQRRGSSLQVRDGLRRQVRLVGKRNDPALLRVRRPVLWHGPIPVTSSRRVS